MVVALASCATAPHPARGATVDAESPTACAGSATLLPPRDTIVVAAETGPEPSSIDSVQLGRAPGAPGCDVALVVRPARGDPRDELDAGVDVLLTRDPATIAYARSRAAFVIEPLPWDRTYALVVPGRPATWMADTSAESRRRLARDAVAAAARGAEGPFWWEQTLAPCPAMSAAGFIDSIVAYHRDDRTARELAERLVALGAARGTRLRAVARSGPGPIRDAAAVIPIFRNSARAEGCERGLADATIVPLIDTRPTAVIRRGRARIAIGPGDIIRILPGDSVAPSR